MPFVSLDASEMSKPNDAGPHKSLSIRIGSSRTRFPVAW